MATPAGGRVAPYNWYVLFVLTCVFALATLDRGIVPVIIEPLRKEFGLTDTQLGFLSGLAFGISYTIAGIPAGLLADRINRRRLLTIAVSVWSVMTALGAFAQSYLHLIVARFAVGAAESAVPTAASLISDYFPARRRPMAMGIYTAGGSIAVAISFALGGFVAHTWGWRAAFLTVGLPGLLVALLLLLTVREPVRGAMEAQKPDHEPAPPFMETVRHLLKLRSAVHIFAGYVISNAIIASFWSWLASLFVRIHGLNIRDAGFLISLGAGLVGFLGAVLGAYLSDRLGKRSLASVLVFVALATALMTPLGVAMCLAPTLPMAIAFMMMVSVLKSSFLGPSQGVLLSLPKVRMRGVTATLLNVSGTFVGFSFGPLITGGLSQLLGGGGAIRYAMAILFVFNLWAALHFWLASRALPRDLETLARESGNVAEPAA